MPSYQINSIPRSHPEERSALSLIERLNDLEAKYKQCQQSVDQLLSDNAVLKERTVKVEQDKRPSYASVIPGPTVLVEQRTQLQQAQRTPGLKGPTEPLILDCINSDKAAGTVPNMAVNSPASTETIHGRTDDLDNIGVIGNNSQMSSYQYPRQYTKKLQLKYRQPNVVTGKKTAQSASSSTFRGA